MLAAVARLAPQVDQLKVILNQYDQVPEEFAQWANVSGVLPPRNLMDLGKFLPEAAGADWVFLVDDDLIYPQTYVARSLGSLTATGKAGAVGGYHATIYHAPKPGLNLASTWRWAMRGMDPRRDRRLIGYWKELLKPTIVAQLGTGTVVLPGKLMPPFTFMEGSAGAVDIRFARWCHENRSAQIALPRPARWLGGVDYDETIFSMVTKKMPAQWREELASFSLDIQDVGMELEPQAASSSAA